MTPRPDLVAQQRKQHPAGIECRQCSFPLGQLSRDRKHPEFTPGVYLIVNLIEQRIDLICPQCGTRRSFTNGIFVAMAVPKIPTARHAKIA